MPGPIVRFIAEAAFLVLVAIAAGFAHLGAAAIIVVMATAWVIVALVERAVAREVSKQAGRARAPEAADLLPELDLGPPPSHVQVIPPTIAPPAPVPEQPAAAPVDDTVAPQPRPAVPAPVAIPVEATPVVPPSVPFTLPEPVAPALDAQPAAPVAEPVDPTRAPATSPPPVPEIAAPPAVAPPAADATPAPPPEPVLPAPVEVPAVLDPPPSVAPPPPVEPVAPLEPVPPLPPQLEIVPPPRPEPVAPPPPTPAPQTVVQLVPQGPRAWNLWELERLARSHAGADAGRDEELSFLLMYLREFAEADGALPVDFDGLVRESFGDLLAAGAR